MAKPTETELIILKKFRAITADLILKPEQRTDMALLRWLRARDLNLQKADDMLRKSLIWRKEMDIDNVLTWKQPAWMEQFFQYEICGHSRDGSPVIVFPFGKWDVRRAVELGEADKWLRLTDQLYARGLEAMNKVNEGMSPDGHPVSQMIIVVDWRGFSMRQFASMTSMQTMMELCSRFEANYPETIKIVYYLNTPRVFSLIWAIMKPLMAEHTLTKIQIFGNNEAKYIPAILKEIAPDQLPIILGGTKKNSCEFLSKDYVYMAKAQDNDNEGGLVSMIIFAGKDLTLEFDVTLDNTIIVWTFETDNYDIGFSIKYNRKEFILPFKKYESHLTREEGSIKCQKRGKYSLTFDNTYSKIHSKNLRYMVVLNEPGCQRVELMH